MRGLLFGRRRARVRGQRIIAVAAVGGALALAASACSTSSKLAPAGGECLVATDCEPGLVCVPQKGTTTRRCSNDLSGVQATEPAPSSDGGRDGSADAPSDAPPTDAGDQDVTQPPVDAAAD